MEKGRIRTNYQLSFFQTAFVFSWQRLMEKNKAKSFTTYNKTSIVTPHNIKTNFDELQR